MISLIAAIKIHSFFYISRSQYKYFANVVVSGDIVVQMGIKANYEKNQF